MYTVCQGIPQRYTKGHAVPSLTEVGYDKMASGEDDLKRLARAGTNIAVTFDQIEAYFKSNVGATVERNDEIFSRALKEMREVGAALGTAKVRILFSGAQEPRGTSKPAYFNNRPSYNQSSFSRGTSHKVSTSPVVGKEQTVGFGSDGPDKP